eukprot:PLAT11240.1.p1 GENE.PLAT11240.1~~PLAT11240.1.p1  ORF type:complete len:1416 (-),score=538.46 PLAT11240.1:34-4254(-)
MEELARLFSRVLLQVRADGDRVRMGWPVAAWFLLIRAARLFTNGTNTKQLLALFQSASSDGEQLTLPELYDALQALSTVAYPRRRTAFADLLKLVDEVSASQLDASLQELYEMPITCYLVDNATVLEQLWCSYSTQPATRHGMPLAPTVDGEMRAEDFHAFCCDFAICPDSLNDEQVALICSASRSATRHGGLSVREFEEALTRLSEVLYQSADMVKNMEQLLAHCTRVSEASMEEEPVAVEAAASPVLADLLDEVATPYLDRRGEKEDEFVSPTASEDGHDPHEDSIMLYPTAADDGAEGSDGHVDGSGSSAVPPFTADVDSIRALASSRGGGGGGAGEEAFLSPETTPRSERPTASAIDDWDAHPSMSYPQEAAGDDAAAEEWADAEEDEADESADAAGDEVGDGDGEAVEEEAKEGDVEAPLAADSDSQRQTKPAAVARTHEPRMRKMARRPPPAAASYDDEDEEESLIELAAATEEGDDLAGLSPAPVHMPPPSSVGEEAPSFSISLRPTADAEVMPSPPRTPAPATSVDGSLFFTPFATPAPAASSRRAPSFWTPKAERTPSKDLLRSLCTRKLVPEHFSSPPSRVPEKLRVSRAGFAGSRVEADAGRPADGDDLQQAIAQDVAALGGGEVDTVQLLESLSRGVQALQHRDEESGSWLPFVEAAVVPAALRLSALTAEQAEVAAAATRLLARCGAASHSCLPRLPAWLRDERLASAHDGLVRAALSVGTAGVVQLLDSLDDGFTATDTLVLTHLANSAAVQARVVVPLLMREARRGKAETVQAAVVALGCLHELAAAAQPLLVELLARGSVDRTAVAWALRTTGGEELLLRLLSRPGLAFRARAAIMESMGIPVLSAPLSVPVSVRTDPAHSSAAPFYLSTDPRGGSVVVDVSEGKMRNVRVVLDVRELVIYLANAVREGVEFDAVTERGSNSVVTVTSLATDESGDDGDDGHSSEHGGERAGIGMRQCSFLGEFHQGDEEESPGYRPVSAIQLDALRNGLQDDNPLVRACAAAACEKLELEEVRPLLSLLLGCLRDEDASVREASVVALGVLCSDARLRRLGRPLLAGMTALLSDELWKVRFAAVVALGRCGEAGRPAIPFLLKSMKDGSVQRKVVAESLARMGREGVAALINLIRSSRYGNTQLRVAAAAGLGKLPADAELIDAVVELLQQLCSTDSASLVRCASLVSLGRLSYRSKEKVTFLRVRSLLPFVYGFMKDSLAAVRSTAAAVLAQLGPQGEMVLMEGALKDSSALIRATAMGGLLKVGPRTVRTLLLALHDSDESVRLAASDALLELGDGRILAVLQKRPPSQRAAVAMSLKEFCSHSMRFSQPLLDCLGRVLRKLTADEEEKEETASFAHSLSRSAASPSTSRASLPPSTPPRSTKKRAWEGIVSPELLS